MGFTRFDSSIVIYALLGAIGSSPDLRKTNPAPNRNFSAVEVTTDNCLQQIAMFLSAFFMHMSNLQTLKLAVNRGRKLLLEKN